MRETGFSLWFRETQETHEYHLRLTLLLSPYLTGAGGERERRGGTEREEEGRREGRRGEKEEERRDGGNQTNKTDLSHHITCFRSGGKTCNGKKKNKVLSESGTL